MNYEFISIVRVRATTASSHRAAASPAHRCEGDARLCGDGCRRPEELPDAVRAAAPFLLLASPLALRADAPRPLLAPLARAGLEPERLIDAGESGGRGGDRRAARGAEDTPGPSVGKGLGGREGARTAPTAAAMPRRRGDGDAPRDCDAPRWRCGVELPPRPVATGARCCRGWAPAELRPVLASRASPRNDASSALPTARLSQLPSARGIKDDAGPGEGDRHEKVSRISPRRRSSSM